MFELKIEQIKMISGGRVDRTENNYRDGSNHSSNDIQWTNRKIGESRLISGGVTIVGSVFGM